MKQKTQKENLRIMKFFCAKLNEIFCAHAAGSRTLYMMNIEYQIKNGIEAKCSLLIARYLLLFCILH